MHFVDAKGILSAQNGMNLYRGCTHGCIYCDARSKCYQMKHDFEDVEVKQNAPELLEKALIHKRKRCMIGTGAMSDPYQHCEKELRLTRRCLEIIERYGFGLAIQTKSDMILRDLDLLRSINRKAKCVVQITLTTADDRLCRLVEPAVCPTSRRVEVLSIMKDEGIPTVVWLTPFLPYINGTMDNAAALFEACAAAGVKGIMLFGAGLTLREGDREYFYRKIDEHFPGLKKRYVREFGDAYEIPCPESGRIITMLKDECRKRSMLIDSGVFSYLREYNEGKPAGQLELF